MPVLLPCGENKVCQSLPYCESTHTLNINAPLLWIMRGLKHDDDYSLPNKTQLRTKKRRRNKNRHWEIPTNLIKYPAKPEFVIIQQLKEVFETEQWRNNDVITFSSLVTYCPRTTILFWGMVSGMATLRCLYEIILMMSRTYVRYFWAYELSCVQTIRDNVTQQFNNWTML